MRNTSGSRRPACGESQQIGIDTLKLDLVDSAAILDELVPGFEAGDYRPAPIAKRFALADAAAAYRAVAAGEQGRMVLLPGTTRLLTGCLYRHYSALTTGSSSLSSLVCGEPELCNHEMTAVIGTTIVLLILGDFVTKS